MPIYVGLHTSPCRGEAGEEPVDPNYQRQLVTFALVANANRISFGVASASFTVVEVGFYDEPTHGHLLYYGATTRGTHVFPGDVLEFLEGHLTISLVPDADLRGDTLACDPLFVSEPPKIAPPDVVRPTAWERVLKDDE